MDVPRVGMIFRVPFEDGDGFLEILLSEEPVADPVDLLLGEIAAAARATLRAGRANASLRAVFMPPIYVAGHEGVSRRKR
jgi:hypothetical protein